MHLLILSDGKKGHENQSLGLAEAIQRRRPHTTIERLNITGDLNPTTPPTAIIAAGHRTHLKLLLTARQHRCPSIVIMRPSLPCQWFTQCLVPEHDYFQRRTPPPNTLTTLGALNRLPEQVSVKKEQGLIMLGGPSKHFHWKLERILQAILKITQASPQIDWHIGDSRRTPPATLEALQDLKLPATIVPHQLAPSNWLLTKFQESQLAWITPDSTSMLFEALTAGCRLGTLPLKRHNTRLSRFQDELANRGWLTRFDEFPDLNKPLPQPPHPLHETARCADHLLETLL